MRKMEDSGIDWIGKIPKEWKVGKVKDVFIRKNEKAKQENPVVLSLARSGVKIRDITKGEGQLAENYSNYNPVEKGDFLLNPMDLYSGANCSTSEVNGVISPAYINLRAKEDNNSKYYDYYFKTQYWAMALFAHGKGVSFENRWTLGVDAVMNYYLPVPKGREQDKISKFLDKKITEIDNVIEKTKQTIEEYKIYKQSVIEEIFNKQEDCNLIRLKFLCDITTGDEDTQNANPDGIYPFYVRSPIVEHCDRYTFEGEGILVAGDGAGAGRIFHHVFDKYAVHQRVYILYNFKCNPTYLHYYLSTLFPYEMDKGSAQSTVPSMRLPMLQNFYIKLPTIKTQEMIVNEIEKKQKTIDLLIEQKNNILTEIQSYKKSLIYEYVTGKKEVI